MRKGSAGSARGVLRFVSELVAILKRGGAGDAVTVRADSGFWSWKLCDRIDAHNVKWSITVTQLPAVRAAIETIPEDAWTSIDYPAGGQAQVAENVYVAGGGATKRRVRRVRLVVRRTRLTEPDQRKLWPDWRYHAFISNRDDPNTVEADAFHREHAGVELTIRDLKEGAGLEHLPSGHYHANAAWLACAVLAHNLSHWTTLLGDQPPTTNRTRRTRYTALAAVTVNRSGRPTLRFAARRPWANQFQTTLNLLRALPAPSA